MVLEYPLVSAVYSKAQNFRTVFIVAYFWIGVNTKISFRCSGAKISLYPSAKIQAYLPHKKTSKTQIPVDCLCSMICAKGEQNYTGDVVRPSDVLDALRKVSPDLGCGDLDEFALSCVNAFCDAMENRNIQNVKSYMKSIIWNGFSEFPVNRETF